MKDNEDPCKTHNMRGKFVDYSNNRVTVHWQPSLCIHSGICWRELPEVFRPRQRKWVMVDGAPAEKVIVQVKKCPSGALSYTIKDPSLEKEPTDAGVKVAVQPNGPLLVDGPLKVMQDGKEIVMQKAALCRCGSSKNKPFCDGTHKSSGFNDQL